MEQFPKKWDTQIASDVIRDGLGMELLDEENNVLAEVFRCDADNSLTISLFRDELPLCAIEALIALARARLEPFEDGSPLSSAKSDI